MELVKSPAKLMRISETRERLGISDYLVRLYAEKGQLRGFQTPGKQWRFYETDVDAFAAKLGLEPAAPNGRDLLPGGELGEVATPGRGPELDSGEWDTK